MQGFTNDHQDLNNESIIAIKKLAAVYSNL